MPRIVLARTFQHEQIEFPEGTPSPDGRRGGGKGALHLRRGKVRDVTPEELLYIQDQRQDLFRALDVLPDPIVPQSTLRALDALARSRPKQAPATAPAEKMTPRKRAPSKKAAAQEG